MSIMVCSAAKAQGQAAPGAPGPGPRAPGQQPPQPAPAGACEGLSPDARVKRPVAHPMPGLPPPDQVSSVEMLQLWTESAYRMSHDGSTVIVHLEDGIEVHRGGKKKKLVMDLSGHIPRSFIFHPDSRRVAFFAPDAPQPGGARRGKRVALMDVTALHGPDHGAKPFEIIYDAADRDPFGLEWSPKGDALFVIEHLWADGVGSTAIRRVDLESKKVLEVVRVLGEVDWFMPPVSRFENGSGPSAAPFKLVYGATDGLYATDPLGRAPERISDLPALGLTNIEWNPAPGKNQVLLFFTRQVTDATGRALRGVYLLDLDATPRPELTPLHPHTDVHTIWYSPKGKYVSWSSPSGVWFRPTSGGETRALPAPPDAKGQPLEVKGMCWSDDESRVAFTAGTALFVHHVQTDETELKVWFEGLFAAEPRFMDEDRIVLTLFEDIRLEMWNRRNTPKFDMPLKGAKADPPR